MTHKHTHAGSFTLFPFQNTKNAEKPLKGKITELQRIEIKPASGFSSPTMDAEDRGRTPSRLYE